MKKILGDVFNIQNKTILILLIILLFMLTGCSQVNNSKGKNGNISNVTAVSKEIISSDAANTEPIREDNIVPTEKPKYPVLDKELTEALTTYMYESFGGFGKEQYATSWYKYIDYWEVYQNEDSYSGILHLKEQPSDASVRIFLSKYYTDNELDKICPILLDAGASLNLDEVDLCLIGEALYKIKTSEDAETNYYALEALNIPVYNFLAKGSGWSINDVKNAIKGNKIPGKEAYECLIDYIAHTYKDAYNGLTMKKVKNISMAAINNFEDVKIKTIDVVDMDGKSIGIYKNSN